MTGICRRRALGDGLDMGDGILLLGVGGRAGFRPAALGVNHIVLHIDDQEGRGLWIEFLHKISSTIGCAIRLAMRCDFPIG